MKKIKKMKMLIIRKKDSIYNWKKKPWEQYHYLSILLISKWVVSDILPWL